MKAPRWTRLASTLCVLTLGVSIGRTASAETLTLEEALARWRRGNLLLVAARYELDAARADVVAAGVLPNPTLGLDSHVVTHGVPTSGQQDVSVSLSQTVPLAGQVGLRRRTAESYANAAEQDFAATVIALSAELREAYLRLQITSARQRLITRGVDDLGHVEAIITQRTSAGANPTYDALRVAVERGNLAARLADAESELALARYTLAQAIGKNVAAPSLTPSELGEPPETTVDLDSALGRAAKRPEALAARLRLDAGTLHVRALARSYVPSPTVGVGYTHWFAVDDLPGPRDGGALFLQLSLPLPIFDHGQGTVHRAMAEREAARARAELVDLTLRRDVERAHATSLARTNAWRRYRESTLGNINRLRQIAELSYKEGRASILELLDAYRSYLESEDRALDLRGNALRAAADLDRALGR